MNQQLEDVLAAGIDAHGTLTVSEIRKPCEMLGRGDPRIWWDADVVDPELAQIVRWASACRALRISHLAGGES